MENGFQITIQGLLRKRSDAVSELQSLRERMAVLSNDVNSINRVLKSLGYQEDCNEPRESKPSKLVVFYRNELRLYALAELQRSKVPLSTRELAQRLIRSEGREAQDKQFLLETIRRMGRALQASKVKGLVRNKRIKNGLFVWHLTSKPQ